MRINHNIAALNTHRQLNSATTQQSKSMEKLASGLRINKAGDDAAGLAISEKMRGQIRGLDQASKNAQDGISMIATAEGALNETHDILQRMRELSVQSSNDTSTEDDRNKIQEEMNQLTSEINRIGNTTEFNTQKLLDGGGVKSTPATMTPGTPGARAGAVSVVSENTMSITGKATGTATYAAGAQSLTITADSAGTDLNGKTIKFVQGTNDSSVSIATNGDDITITVGQALTSVATINSAIQSQGSLPTKFTVSSSEAGGNFSADALAGVDVVVSGGASEKLGNYSFDINSAFEDDNDTFDLVLGNGNTITINGGLGGEFTAGETANEQAASIAAALNLDGNFTANYEAKTVDSKLVITEIAGSATGVKPAISGVTTAAVAGDYDLTVTDASKVAVGGKYTIDGQDIKVTDDATDAGLAKGTAILAGATATDQANNLKTAIELNTTLNVKYAVTVPSGSTVNLEQKVGHESNQSPKISTSDTTKTGFEASFQIGANSGQSMTIQVEDMRSAALGISGGTASGTVTAGNGKVASYVATKNVTDGSTNDKSEFALDVSSHEKASAAISVINDAINSVSAERSKLGANQNRLEHTINNLGTSSENLTAAESRIRDVDYALAV